MRAMRNTGRNIKATTAMPIQPLECSDSIAGYAIKEDRRSVAGYAIKEDRRFVSI